MTKITRRSQTNRILETWLLTKSPINGSEIWSVLSGGSICGWMKDLLDTSNITLPLMYVIKILRWCSVNLRLHLWSHANFESLIHYKSFFYKFLSNLSKIFCYKHRKHILLHICTNLSIFFSTIMKQICIKIKILLCLNDKDFFKQ